MQLFLEKHRKPIMAVIGIVLYMTALCLVSAVKHIPEFETLDGGAVLTSDFAVAAGENSARIEGPAMIIEAGEGDKVFSAPVSLTEGTAFHVAFTVDCPPESAGRILHVDLYGEGYDSPESEFVYELKAGKNTVSGELPFGMFHPDASQLRLFTVDRMNAVITDLQVARMAQFQGVPMGVRMLTVTVLLLAAVESVLFFSWYLNIRKRVSEDGSSKRRERSELVGPVSETGSERSKVSVLVQYRKDIIYAGVLALGLFVVMFFFLGFAKNGLDAPFLYSGGDDFAEIAKIKAVGDNGWVLHNNYVGAPYGTYLMDFPSYLLVSTDLLITKLLMSLIGDPFIVQNVQYLLVFALCGVTAFFVLRALGIQRHIAALGSVLFALAPYIFSRSVAHFVLSSCYFIPLSVLLCVWSYEGKEPYLSFRRGFWREKRNLCTVVFALLIANNGIGYYAFFTCFFLCVVALYRLISEQNWRAVKQPFTVIGLILFFSALALLPMFFYHIQYGDNAIAQRSPVEAELYGLKITQLFIPLNGHGIEGLENLINSYNRNMPLVNENSSAYLGVGAIIGFLLSLLSLFLPVDKLGRVEDRRLQLFARLNICAILFATIGGFSSLFTLLVHAMRSYNRISIFMQFISVCVLCICLQKLCKKIFSNNQAWRKVLLGAALLLLVAVCLFDQLPTYGASDASLQANRANRDSDRNFVAEIENVLHPGDLVFQLPYHKTPEGGPVNAMTDYQLYAGYIHSKTLKWSYGGIKGREADKWNEYVSGLPVDRMIQTIIPSGFRGIYIDMRAYTEQELSQLKLEIEAVLHQQPMVSENSCLLFYNLYPYLNENSGLLEMEPLTAERP